MLQIEGLRKSYGKLRVLEGVDLHVAIPLCIAEDVYQVGQPADIKHVHVGAE